jgi:acetate kinase
MKILILTPGSRSLHFSVYTNDYEQADHEGRVKDYRSPESGKASIHHILTTLQYSSPEPDADLALDAVAIRLPFGGEPFQGPTVVSPSVLQELARLIPHAPLHIPVALSLIKALQELMEEVPVILIFETAFFTQLSEREYLYAVDPDLISDQKLRRYGYHGVFHEAACVEARRHLASRRLKFAAKILSICLEPRPEIAAVMGARPVTVSGGATPLEGLPGQISCGELDPSIVITLAQKLGWGTEQINTVLTTAGGLRGLAGEAVSLSEVFLSNNPRHQLAREVMQYRILQTCGAGVAALGGLDAIVFSGRYARLGTNLRPWLEQHLNLQTEHPITWVTLDRAQNRLVADQAWVALRQRESMMACG